MMKRIYKNNDLVFNLTINDFPINKDLIKSIEFKFYTLDSDNYITKTQSDIDEYNQVIIQWDELKNLEEGVLYYDYTVSLNNTDMVDGTLDNVVKRMTNYYLCSNIHYIDNMGESYYTKDEVDDLINDVVVGTIDLTDYYTKEDVDFKFQGYVEDSALGSYYTKNEVNELIEGIDIPTQDVDLSNYYTKTETYSKGEVNTLIDGVSSGDVDLTNYYTKNEVDAKIPSTEGFITEIPSEYVTDSELNAKGYLTEHQSLVGYAKLTDIPSLDGYSLTSHTHEEYLTSIPSEYVTDSELNAKGYLTEHQSLTDYYKKSETYSQSEINSLIDGVSAGDVDLTNYYTKTEVDEKIPSEYIKAFNIGSMNDENFQVEDGVVNMYTQFYDGSYDMNVDSNSVFGIKPIDNTIVLESAGGTGNGNFRCGIKVNTNALDYYSKSEVDNLISGINTGSSSSNVDLTNYYTKDEVDAKIPSTEGFITSVPSEYITESELATSLNGYSTTSHTHSEYITEQYDDTSLANRITALETELNGVSEQITEINNMVV